MSILLYTHILHLLLWHYFFLISISNSRSNSLVLLTSSFNRFISFRILLFSNFKFASVAFSLFCNLSILEDNPSTKSEFIIKHPFINILIIMYFFNTQLLYNFLKIMSIFHLNILILKQLNLRITLYNLHIILKKE